MTKTMRHRAVALISVVVSLVLSTGTPSFAQSVADAARQERERKRQLALHAVHVYTNDDLTKQRILIPADEARVAARENEPLGIEAPDGGTSTPAVPMIPRTPIVADEADPNVTTPAVVSNVANPPASWVDSTPIMLRSPLPSVAAPTISQQIDGSLVLGPLTSARTTATMAIPASVSRPLPKEAGNSTHTPEAVVVSGIKIPATTMPFSNSSAYGSESLMLPAMTSNSLVVTDSSSRVRPPAALPAVEIRPSEATIPFVVPAPYGTANFGIPAPNTPAMPRQLRKDAPEDVSAPLMPSAMLAVPSTLTLTEHTIIRPVGIEKVAIENRFQPETCARPCDVKATITTIARVSTNTIAPTMETRPDVAVSTLGRAAGSLARPAAIMDAAARIKVEAGDSLWKLAERYLGNGLRWKRLAALNPQVADPSRILVGQWIHIPADRRQQAKQVVIQPGETLWKVARATIGGSFALACIAQANPQLRSVNAVRAGETLNVPANCSNLQNAEN
jgi:nucleoid-associated protein YgaU